MTEGEGEIYLVFCAEKSNFVIKNRAAMTIKSAALFFM